MDDKRTILEKLFPKAVLKALTPEAHAAIPVGMQVGGMVTIHAFPFRVGRESRVAMVNNRIHRIERPGTIDGKHSNDMYLMDTGHLLQISREHFRIDHTVDGYMLTDRGSKCGLSVNGKRLGHGAGIMTMPLHDGSVIGVGTAETRYHFTFIAGFDNSRW